MTTIVNAAVAAVLAALSAAPAVAPQVSRVRLRPLSAGTSTAVVVRPVQAEVLDSEMTGFPYAWNAAIAVECYARCSTGSPDVAVDALLASAYSRLMSDPTLGGAVVVLQPIAVSFDFDVDGESTVCATLQINARLQSAGSNF